MRAQHSTAIFELKTNIERSNKNTSIVPRINRISVKKKKKNDVNSKVRVSIYHTIVYGNFRLFHISRGTHYTIGLYMIYRKAQLPLGGHKKFSYFLPRQNLGPIFPPKIVSTDNEAFTIWKLECWTNSLWFFFFKLKFSSIFSLTKQRIKNILITDYH